MDFYTLKKKLGDYSSRGPGSEKVNKLFDELKKNFSSYEAETITFRSPSHKGWTFASLLIFTIVGLIVLRSRPLLSVILVVVPAMLLLWEENGYVIWSVLFSFTHCQDLVLKKGDEPQIVFVVNADSRVEGLWDRIDPEGITRTSWLNLTLLLASFTTVLSFYFPIKFWLYAGLVICVVLILELLDYLYQGITHHYYPGSLDNGSGMLVLRSISDMVTLPHWIVFVDGGNVGGGGIAAFKKHYKLPRNVLYIALEKPGVGKVAVAQRHGLWSAVTLPKEVKQLLIDKAHIETFSDYSYRRSLAAYLNFRGCAAFAIVGQPSTKNEANLLLTDTVDCINDQNIQEASSLVLRLVNMLEQPGGGSGNGESSNSI